MPSTSIGEESVFLWWNVWLDNFQTTGRESALLEALDRLIEEYSPTVVSLQEVIARRDGSGAIATRLSEHGYASYFEAVSPRISSNPMGNMIASSEPHRYFSFDCGVHGHRRTSLQMLELSQPHLPITIGNTHWLMMRPVFELNRWRQMTRMLETVDNFRESGRSLIVGGDLNTATHHPYMARLKRRYRVLPGDKPTWRYGARSRLIKARLDHVFSSGPVSGSCQILDAGPSDHCPLVARVEI